MDTGDEEQDYVVQVDEIIKVCYALNTKTPDFEQNNEWGLFKIRYNRDGTINLSSISTGHNNFVFHGIVMYFCWFILGFLLLGTKRYFHFNWKLMHLAHIFLGTIVFVVSTFFGLKIIAHFAWNVHPDYHQFMGVGTIIFTIAQSLLGIVTVTV